MLVALVSPFGGSEQVSRAERLTGRDRAEKQEMLRIVYNDIRNNYYDPKFHGVDWDAKFAESQEKIAKAVSQTEADLLIAGLLETLNDSHAIFIPPQHAIGSDYGWQYQMVGDRCYVTHVRPGTDAEIKGLKPGDEVLTINGFTPDRENLDKMEYVLNVLYPQTGLRLAIRDQSGKIRRVEVMAMEYFSKRVRAQSQPIYEPKYRELGKQLMVLKLPSLFVTDLEIDELIGKARKHNTLVVDLRGNEGGPLSTVKEFLRGVFEQDVKIVDEIRRDKTTPLIAKGRQDRAFTGKLIVLADSKSASGAELIARMVQLEKRGIVLGDLTSGRVMAAEYHPHPLGTGLATVIFGVMVSVADFVMTDGKSLEHIGVTPDEKMLPSKEDLLNNRDPVMSHAAEIAGVTLSPEKAGELFPYEWPIQ